MKEKVICFLVLALVSSSTLMFGQDSILDYWDKKEVFPDSVICPAPPVSPIPENVVLDYLCNTRNDCFINPNSRYRLHYYPVCKVEARNYWLLMYEITDGYSIDRYIASYIESEDKIAYRLHVYSSVGCDLPTIFYKLRDDRIEIFRKIPKIEDYPGQDTIQEIYRLDRSLSLISSNFPEDDFIPILTEDIIPDFQLSRATNEKSIIYKIEGLSSEGAEAKVNYVNGKISKSITTVYGETAQATIIYEFEAQKIKVLETKYSYKRMIEDVESDNDMSLDYRISYFIDYDGKVVGAEAPEHIDIFREFQRVVPFEL